jgi:hypothetical protein
MEWDINEWKFTQIQCQWSDLTQNSAHCLLIHSQSTIHLPILRPPQWNMRLETVYVLVDSDLDLVSPRLMLSMVLQLSLVLRRCRWPCGLLIRCSVDEDVADGAVLVLSLFFCRGIADLSVR